MSEAEEKDAIGGTCECEEIERFLESVGKRHKNGNGSSAPRDDNPYLPPLSYDIALLILARLPCSKYRDLCKVNRRFRSLIRSGGLYRIRKEIGIKEPKVFLLSKNSRRYLYYEPRARFLEELPACPYNETIAYHAKKSFCVGTHLLVVGIIKEKDNAPRSDSDIFWSDSDIWRYELESKQWFQGPMMNTPRYFFAFADCDSVACVAGGNQQVSGDVLNSAEKYNPKNEAWEPLPNMHRRRRFCSGVYMDSKFYVISGQNEHGNLLSCGECYDFERNVWVLIPNMLENDKSTTLNPCQFTDFMVVVNNELYYLEFPSYDLKVYLKNNNTWKNVGSAPVSLDKSFHVVLKSLGNELLLICRRRRNHSTQEIVLCFCTPSPELDDVEWHVLDFNPQGRNLSIYNCCVMMV